MKSEEIFRPEIHTLFFRPFLDDATEKLGAQRVSEMLAGLGVTEAQLRDPTGWVSLQFREQFFVNLLGAGIDEGVFERCGRMVFTHKHAGILFPLLRTFGTPILAYGRIAQSVGRFNKVGRMELHGARPGYISVQYRPLPGAPAETTAYVCRARAAQLAAVPMVFDFAPATVNHPICLHEGRRSLPLRSRLGGAGRPLAGVGVSIRRVPPRCGRRRRVAAARGDLRRAFAGDGRGRLGISPQRAAARGVDRADREPHGDAGGAGGQRSLPRGALRRADRSQGRGRAQGRGADRPRSERSTRSSRRRWKRSARSSRRNGTSTPTSRTICARRSR